MGVAEIEIEADELHEDLTRAALSALRGANRRNAARVWWRVNRGAQVLRADPRSEKSTPGTPRGRGVDTRDQCAHKPVSMVVLPADDSQAQPTVDSD